MKPIPYQSLPQRLGDEFMNSRLLVLCLSLTLCLGSGCSKQSDYPNRPITLICPWAAGGGTDRVSRQMAVHLEQELGVPVSVVNATGGKGVTGHSRGLGARPDGYTLTMMTLELNTMHWSGLTDLTYENCVPLVSLNEDYAALFVRNDASWQTVPELEQDIRSKPGELNASGTALGGAWHLAIAGWLLDSELEATDINWISETGAGPSLQQLMSGGIDVVCCSLPEARTLLEAGEVRALGVMAPGRVTGFEEVPTFNEQGSDWTLGGWRGLGCPEGTPKSITELLTKTAQRIVTGETSVTIASNDEHGNRSDRTQTFPEFMNEQGFDNTWRKPADFVDFMRETDQKFGTLLQSPSMKSVNEERFNPLMFPYFLMGLVGVTGIGITFGHWLKGARQTKPLAEPGLSISSRGVTQFATIVACVVLYCLIAEQVGFVLTGLAIMFAMLWRLGTRPSIAALISLVLIPIVYQLFAGFLRVPLPQGWLGW